MKNVQKLLCTICAALILTVFNPAMAGEMKQWDASKVLEISDELSDAARRLQIECRTSPPKYVDQESGSPHVIFRYHVRHFMSVSRILNNALEDGHGREKTKPMYDTLAVMRSDLTSYANRPGGAWPKVQRAVEQVVTRLSELGQYYPEE